MRMKEAVTACDDWVAMMRLAGGPRPDEGLQEILTQAFQVCRRIQPDRAGRIDGLIYLIGCRVLSAYMVYLTSRDHGSIDALRGSDDDRLDALTTAVRAMPDTPVDADLQVALRMSVAVRSMAFRAVGL